VKAASALIRAAEAQGVTLWVEGGQLRYKARQPVADGFKDRIREHKAEIIKLLEEKPVATGETRLPEWCDSRCESFHRLMIPEVGTMMWCCQEDDSTQWRRVRIDTMNSCPMEMKF
jgi:hypothetical protein